MQQEQDEEGHDPQPQLQHVSEGNALLAGQSLQQRHQGADHENGHPDQQVEAVLPLVLFRQRFHLYKNKHFAAKPHPFR